jgi:hypothetical protein
LLGIKKKTKVLIAPITLFISYLSFTEFILSYDSIDHAGPKAMFVITAAMAISHGALFQYSWLNYVLLLSVLSVYQMARVSIEFGTDNLPEFALIYILSLSITYMSTLYFKELYVITEKYSEES